jgi:hypothetical protein
MRHWEITISGIPAGSHMVEHKEALTMPRSLQVPFIERAPSWMKVSATLVFGSIFVIAFFLSIQDYQTSVLGYRLIPSQKIDPDTTSALVGALPQLFQIALAWVIASRQKGRKLAILLWLIAFSFDFASDYYFKSSGVTWPSDVLAHALVAASILGETFVLYTFGSEFMLIFAWSNLAPLVTPGISAWLKEVKTHIRAATAGTGGEVGGIFNLDAEFDLEAKAASWSKRGGKRGRPSSQRGRPVVTETARGDNPDDLWG